MGTERLLSTPAPAVFSHSTQQRSVHPIQCQSFSYAAMQPYQERSPSPQGFFFSLKSNIQITVQTGTVCSGVWEKQQEQLLFILLKDTANVTHMHTEK